MPSRIAVIIPTFNRRECLPRALDSVLAQTRFPDEIIVVDDGSTDGTFDYISQQYSAIPQLQIVLQDNKGVSSARNVGIKAANADWIAFLDSDDAWQPEKLQKQLTHLDSQPNYKIAHNDEIWIRKGVRVNPMKKHAKKGGWIFQHCLPLCAISPSAVMIHRDVFSDVGFFNEQLPACEDYDLWLRITHRYPVLFLEDMLTLKYGGHDDQLSKRYWGMDRFRIQALDDLLTHSGLNDADYQAALTMLIHKITVYLQGAIKREKRDEVIFYQSLLDKYEVKYVAA